MDNEILDMIKDKLLNVKMIIESSIDDLDVETSESLEIGKTIALEFDNSDLTDVQVSVDNIISQLQDLSDEIEGFLG